MCSRTGVHLPRDKSVDALKGLAIALVVLGHAILDADAVQHGGKGLVSMGPFWVPLATASSLLLTFVYSFHMPLFAFVSGLVMWPPRDRPLGAGILGRARGLLVPYVAWFAVLYAINWSPHPAGGFADALRHNLIGRGGLWYLYALFICVVAVLLLARIPGSRWALPVSAVVAVACSTGLMFRVPDVLYLSYVFWIYPFVVLGYMVGPARAWFAEHRWALVVGGVTVFTPLLFLRQPVKVPSLQPLVQMAASVPGAGAGAGDGHLLWVLLRIAIGVLPYVCGAAAVVAIYSLYLGREGRVIDAQAWLGQKSLGIYAMHGTVVWWFASHGVKNVALLSLVALGVSVAATLALERVPVLGAVLLGQRITWTGWRPIAREPSREMGIHLAEVMPYAANVGSPHDRSDRCLGG